jgi:4-hydroxyphenylacetate 3-monooxygenase
MPSSVKTGREHLASLRDGRTVWLNGQGVTDVTTHPAYRNAVHTSASLYDFQAKPENLERMTFDIGGGRRVNRQWQAPRNYAELVERRKALTAWAEVHMGFMGRSPDHVASSILGQWMNLELFRRHGEARAKAVDDYFHYARENDLFLTYVIINPQADKSKAWGEQAEEDLVAKIVDEDSGGLTIRGAKMLGTSSIMANEVFRRQPAAAAARGDRYRGVVHAADEREGPEGALAQVVRAARGLALRQSARLAVRRERRLMYFDDVKVPWERVFVHRNPDMCRAQFHDTPAHTLQNYQSQIRLAVKMRFLTGVARKLTETIGTVNMPPVRERLGWLAAKAAMVDSMVYGMEAAGYMAGDYYMPDKHLMYTAQVVTQELYPQFIATIRELAGGSLIMLPSSVEDMANPELAKIIGKTQVSPAMAPAERVKFLKLAWDAVGSEFASRHLQYEMFYAGAQFVTSGHSFRTYDWARATAMSEHVLAGYSAPGAGGTADPAAAKRAA